MEQADIICLAVAEGADVHEAWHELEESYVSEQIRWRYYDGACLIGVGKGASLLGLKGYKPDGEKSPGVTRWWGFKTFEIVPHIFTDDDSGVCEDVAEAERTKRGSKGEGTTGGGPRAMFLKIACSNAAQPDSRLDVRWSQQYRTAGPHRP